MYGPKPLIEEHYHIQDLINGQQKRVDDREFHRIRIKNLAERTEDIKKANAREVKGFWCQECKADFFGETIKQVETDWTCPTQYIAFYRAKCPKGHWCARHITDQHKDGYHVRSRRIALDRGIHYADTLQPHQTGFNLLYKKI